MALLVNHTYSYPFGFLTAAAYGLDITTMKNLFTAGYCDLLVDISEGFGIWITLLVLTTSSMSLTVNIQQFNASAILGVKNLSTDSVKSN